MALTNSKDSHKYWMERLQAPSVTTFCSNGLRKQPVELWNSKTVAEFVADNPDKIETLRALGRDAMVAALKKVPYTKRDEAARRGTEVHALAEELIHGREVEVPDAISGHVEAYVQFLDEWQPKPVLVETMVGNREQWYAGTLDMVIDLPDGQRVIADIKTGRSGIFPETALQLAAYRHAEFYVDADGTEQSMSELDITGGLGIWLHANGYEVYRIPCGREQFAKFLHVAESAKFTQCSKDLIGPPLELPEWEQAV